MQMKFKIWGLCGSLFMGMGGEVEATEYHLYPAEMGRADETTGDFPSIQAALDGASSGDVITLYPGVYPASLHFPRVDVKLRGHPDFEASQIVLQGIECGGATEASWCSILHFDWQGEGPLADGGQARVENLTLLGGEGALFDGEGPQHRRFGGALWMHSADPHLTDLVIKGNRVSGMGGGL